MGQPCDKISREYSSYVVAATGKSTQMTNDITKGSNILQILAETVTFSAGVAGTTGVVALDKRPVSNVDGAIVGIYGDSSFSWVTGTILTTEILYNDSITDAAFLATMSNGNYAIDYVNGRIFYCKATAGTTDTCNYKTSQLNIEVTGASDTAADSTSSGTVAATNGAGGTQIVAANSKRRFTQCQNNGGVNVYFGTGTVTSSYLMVVPNGTFTWHSKEALKVLSSGANCNIAYTDYLNA